MLKGSHHTEISKEKMSENRLGRPAWNKGKRGLYHHSEESKQKLRERSTGRHHTFESILKMKGRTVWNKGLHGVVVISEETRKRLRENNPRYWQGKHFSAEHRKKISESNTGPKNKCWGKPSPLKGRPRSEETKKKISSSNIGKRKGMVPWIKGRYHTEESKQKNREKHIGKSINAGANHPQWGKKGEKSPSYGLRRSKETIQKLREKSRESQKKLWQNEEHAKRMMALFNTKPNGSELYLDFLLQNHFPDEWWFVGDGQVILSGLCPDFVNVNGKKLIIELFGEHCHTDGGCFAGKKIAYRRTEAGRREVFAKPGYSTLIIWWDELADEKKVIEKIRDFSMHHNI